MALSDLPVYDYPPRIPSPEELAARIRESEVTVRYNPLADELLILWSVPAEFAVSVFLDDPDWLALRIDPDTGELVGFHIVDFLSRAVQEQPELLPLARLARIPDDELGSIGREIPSEEPTRSAVRVLACLAGPR
jgi:hypothetical protein